MEARYYHKTENQVVECLLCPHFCRIKPGQKGLCRIRENREGSLRLPFYGIASSLAIDPIEKKPLYHFYPGRQILSVGFWGCNLRCPFCQNYQISQTTSTRGEYLEPAELVDLALQKKSFALAYTYSEPLIHWEYLRDTAALAREKGLKNVLVSNGQLNPEPAGELLEFLDAANIDLKSFNPDYYKRELRGKLETVKEFIRTAAGRLSLEVTTLVIPGKNDLPEEIDAIAGFLASINPGIPLHLSCYYPTYHSTIPPTPARTVFKLAEVARRHLRFVYPGNVGLEAVNTQCPACGELLINRQGYRVSLSGLEGSRCRACSTPVAIPGLEEA